MAHAKMTIVTEESWILERNRIRLDGQIQKTLRIQNYSDMYGRGLSRVLLICNISLSAVDLISSNISKETREN